MLSLVNVDLRKSAHPRKNTYIPPSFWPNFLLMSTHPGASFASTFVGCWEPIASSTMHIWVKKIGVVLHLREALHWTLLMWPNSLATPCSRPIYPLGKKNTVRAKVWFSAQHLFVLETPFHFSWLLASHFFPIRTSGGGVWQQDSVREVEGTERPQAGGMGGAV